MTAGSFGWNGNTQFYHIQSGGLEGLSRLRQQRRSLFVSQVNERVHASGATRRNEAGRERNEYQHTGNDNICERISGADHYETSDEAAGSECEGDSNDQADRDDEKSIAENHLQNVRRLRTESHAHSNLVGFLARGIRNDSVHANNREYQSQNAEQSSEYGAELEGEQAVESVERLPHGLDVKYGQLRGQ